ncbi:MAG TPA: STAS domain-containing protein [bacterium]|nr:STAS domain-containing protein [bacterium]HPR86944.1 STAS domain-containing protein [bacterium]
MVSVDVPCSEIVLPSTQRMVNDRSMSSFGVKTQLCSQILIIFARGYLNLAGAEAILRTLGHPASRSISRVVLVVEEVTAANSMGISRLHSLLELLKARKGGLALVRAKPELIRTFHIMGIYNLAFKAESVRQAMEMLS